MANIAKKERTFPILLNDEEYAKYKEASENFDIKMAELFRSGADLKAGFNVDFCKRLQRFAEAFRIPEYVVLQNLTLSWMARREADVEVWGERPELLFEFPVYQYGPQPAEELFADLKKRFVDEFSKEKELVLLEKLKQLGPTKMPPDELEFLKDRGISLDKTPDPFQGLSPESRAVAERGLVHHRKVKAIELKEGKEAALEYIKRHKEGNK